MHVCVCVCVCVFVCVYNLYMCIWPPAGSHRWSAGHSIVTCVCGRLAAPKMNAPARYPLLWVEPLD